MATTNGTYHLSNHIDWPALIATDLVSRLITLALDEDVGSGDVTTEAIFGRGGPRQVVKAHVVARTATVACAVPLAKHLLARFDPGVLFVSEAAEGARLNPGETLLVFEADVRAVLTVERTLLNFLMRLCGVAWGARACVEAIGPELHAKVYDTRKTTPGLRLLEKAAVRTGGAANHRIGLYDAVLIKDNHVAAAGSVKRAVELCRAHVGKSMVLEVEIDRLDQLDEALDAGADIVLLDNFSDADMATAVRQTAGRAELEASGGVRHARLAAIAQTGVQRISMGALTHSVMPADLSLEILA
jgi:nicotinate-nucleotide pyrophosphorylase (carboxylating)